MRILCWLIKKSIFQWVSISWTCLLRWFTSITTTRTISRIYFLISKWYFSWLTKIISFLITVIPLELNITFRWVNNISFINICTNLCVLENWLVLSTVYYLGFGCYIRVCTLRSLLSFRWFILNISSWF